MEPATGWGVHGVLRVDTLRYEIILIIPILPESLYVSIRWCVLLFSQVHLY